jgi:hypothetical protein
MNDLLKNLRISLDDSGKVVTVINVSTGKVLAILDGEDSHTFLAGRLTFSQERVSVGYEDDCGYEDCND